MKDKVIPKLIDYSLITFPKKELSNIQKKIIKTDNTKLYINSIFLIILLLGIYILYTRFKDKNKRDIENVNNILIMNEYINSSLNYKDTIEAFNNLENNQ